MPGREGGVDATETRCPGSHGRRRTAVTAAKRPGVQLPISPALSHLSYPFASPGLKKNFRLTLGTFNDPNSLPQTEKSNKMPLKRVTDKPAKIETLRRSYSVPVILGTKTKTCQTEEAELRKQQTRGVLRKKSRSNNHHIL